MIRFNPILPPPSVDTGFWIPTMDIFITSCLVRIFLLQIIAHAMRQREYLADAWACEKAFSPEIMGSALKKVNLFLRTTTKTFGELNYTEADQSFLEDFKNPIDAIVKLIKGEISWHPLTSDRIQAVSEGKYSPEKTKIKLLSIGDVVISTILIMVFEIMVGIIFFDVFNKNSERLSSVLFIGLAAMITPAIISMLSCLPLRFWDARSLELEFIPGRPGSQSESRAIMLLAALFYKKNWLRIHRNNIVAILIAWFLAYILLDYIQDDFSKIFWIFLPVALVSCTGICVIYVINSINAKYRAEQGISPIIR